MSWSWDLTHQCLCKSWISWGPLKSTHRTYFSCEHCRDFGDQQAFGVIVFLEDSIKSSDVRKLIAGYLKRPLKNDSKYTSVVLSE